MKRIILFVIISSLYFVVPSYGEKMRIVIMDFKADGVQAATANRVSELIRTEMINSGEFLIIERKQMDMIFKEQGFQKTGCTDESCAVEIGRLLSARKILIGTVMKLGETIIINGRIVDVEKGVAEFGEKQDAVSEKDLFNAVTLFTEKLTARIQGREVTDSYGQGKGVKGEINYDSPNYHSPAKAAWVSLLPVWSGSWNKGFGVWGLLFVAAKTSSFVLLLSYASATPPDRSDYGYTTAGNAAYDKAKTEYADKIVMATLMAYAWIGTTIGDLVYSIFSVRRYNYKNAVYTNNFQEGDINLTFQPRFYQDYCGIYRQDGINLSVSYRF